MFYYLFICSASDGCLEFYILTTSKVLSGRVLSCDCAHLWRLYSAIPLGDQTANISGPLGHIILTLSQPSPCPILIVPSARLGSGKYQFYKSLFWARTPDLEHAMPALYRFSHCAWSLDVSSSVVSNQHNELQTKYTVAVAGLCVYTCIPRIHFTREAALYRYYLYSSWQRKLTQIYSWMRLCLAGTLKGPSI